MYRLIFIQEFQILIRKNLPIFLLTARLYDDIESIENTDGLTFFGWQKSMTWALLISGVIPENILIEKGIIDGSQRGGSVLYCLG